MLQFPVGRITRVVHLIAVGLFAAACATEPFEPRVPTPYQVPPATPYDTLATVRADEADETTDMRLHGRLDELAGCDSLAAPAGSRLALRTFAKGVQIYRWSGSEWTFVAPEATLHPTERAMATIGTHYAGPTWELLGGSTVKAAVLKRCPSSQGAIPWLLLGVTSAADRGLFRGVTHIQRLATVQGTAPSAPGTIIGEERRVPYTAVYRFYRAR